MGWRLRVKLGAKGQLRQSSGPRAEVVASSLSSLSP